MAKLDAGWERLRTGIAVLVERGRICGTCAAFCVASEQDRNSHTRAEPGPMPCWTWLARLAGSQTDGGLLIGQREDRAFG